jgi:transcriptional regulator with XRE-family HTH domain
MDYSTFEYLLKSTGTTVYRVSKETGIAASTFTDWKNGRSCPKADKLKRIAAFFGVSLDELLGGEAVSSTHAAPRAGKLPIIGEIRAGSPIITYNNLMNHTTEQINIDDAIASDSIVSGHGGGDSGIIRALADLFKGNKWDSVCDIEESSHNHMLAFAAESSRLAGGALVNVDEYVSSVGEKQ